jgi:dihydroorotase
MKITLNSPLDMHLHLRETEMLKLVAPLSAAPFAGAVVMPNLISPIDSLQKVLQYRKEIQSYCTSEIFEPYMTLFFRAYTREELETAKNEIIGIKLYPAGITTQSENGVSDFSAVEPTLEILQDLHIPLLVHGETNGFVMERETEFLSVYEELARNFPKLHIIMEHITTAAAIHFLEKYDNVSATVTLHHLMITLDDVVGGMMQPDLFCKPIAKTPADRQALRKAVFSGNKKIMFGSDSAPHPRHKKECVGCAAGVFSSPVALPLLAQIFEEENCLNLLQAFVSDNAIQRYGITPPVKEVTLSDTTWKVPAQYGDVRPFFAEEKLRWSIC